MGSVFDQLLAKNLLNTPPSFLKNNIHYEVITGSVAYGCNEKGKSDKDIYGLAIQPKDLIFPHTAGYIQGFDKNIPVFNQFQQHHIYDTDKEIEYDITIYGIVQFFKLCTENNPNMLDSLFVPRRCVVYSSQIGEYIRDNRQHFLHKGAYFKFRGYAKSQLHKMRQKVINQFIAFCKEYDLDYNITIDEINNYDLPSEQKKKLLKLINQIDKDGQRTKRIDMISKYGYDLKFAYHLVRLFMECEQILKDHTIVLDRDREVYKSIRRGDWSKNQILQFFEENETRLQTICDASALPSRPNTQKIKQILLDCLEMHYGSLENCVASLDKYALAVRDIKQLIFDRKL